jgi:hypothetical protein
MENKNKQPEWCGEEGLDVTHVLLTLELVRSFKAHWKSKELVLKFYNRDEMRQFVDLMNVMYCACEDILEEENE